MFKEEENGFVLRTVGEIVVVVTTNTLRKMSFDVILVERLLEKVNTEIVFPHF